MKQFIFITFLLVVFASFSGAAVAAGKPNILICWPAQLKPGEWLSPVSSLDILPTALAAAGVEAPNDPPLDGRNLLPLLRGEAAPQLRDLFWWSGSDEGWWAVRSGDWKLVCEKGKISLFDLGKVLTHNLRFMFDRSEGICFTHSPNGGGANRERQTTNPAWDFQSLIPNPELMKNYGFKVRAVLRPRFPRSEVPVEFAKWKEGM